MVVWTLWVLLGLWMCSNSLSGWFLQGSLAGIPNYQTNCQVHSWFSLEKHDLSASCIRFKVMYDPHVFWCLQCFFRLKLLWPELSCFFFHFFSRVFSPLKERTSEENHHNSMFLWFSHNPAHVFVWYYPLCFPRKNEHRAVSLLFLSHRTCESWVSPVRLSGVTSSQRNRRARSASLASEGMVARSSHGGVLLEAQYGEVA